MDVAFGIKGKDFVLCVCDLTQARSIVAYKHDEDKIIRLDQRQLLACGGEAAARTEFSEYISKNLALMRLRAGRPLSNHAAANFIRSETAAALRSRGAYQSNSLFAAFDEYEGPALYYLDYLGTLQKLDYGAHGYCAYFVLSTMDKEYLPNITADQGVDLAKKCCDQLARRFLIHLPKFMIKLINEEGVIEEVYYPKFQES